jgi:hypothetical protein
MISADLDPFGSSVNGLLGADAGLDRDAPPSLAPSLATLPARTHHRLNTAIDAHLAPLLRDGKVSGKMTSNIAIARK